MSVSAEASISEVAMLLPSPVYTTRHPARRPATSSRVSREVVGEGEELSQLPPVEVGEVDEVATLQRNHRSDHDRSPDYRPGYRRGSISSPATIGEMARSRNESNSGSRERSFGSSRSRRIRSRQAAGSSPKRAGLKLSGISCLIWIVRRSVTRTFGHE